jgi:hypothetical protein
MTSREPRRPKFVAIAAAVVLSLSACGGSASDGSDAAELNDAAELGDDAASAEQSSDQMADLRASATLADGAFQGLTADNQLCMLTTISQDESLSDALIAGDESPPVQIALMRVLLECDGEAAFDLISGGDGGLDQLSEEEFTCLIDSMLADDAVLADAVSGTGQLIAGALLECAPQAAVADLASELGITTEQATCLMTSGNGFLDLLMSGEPSTDEEVMEFLGALAEVSAECGLDDVFGLSEMETATSSDVDSGDYVEIDEDLLDEQYELCADGDMVACDDLYFNAPFGSDEEAFGKSCGDTAESEFGGSCASLNMDYRSDCAAGDMEACDQLFFLSEVGSDDENFGATCGGTADGTTAGLCSDPEN